MKIFIYYTATDLFKPAAHAEIECPWPTMPRKGEELHHCGDWGADTINGLSWSLDGTAEMLIRGADEELLDHLVAEHGFSRR